MDIAGDHQLVLELIQIDGWHRLDHLSDKQLVNCVKRPLAFVWALGVRIGSPPKLSIANDNIVNRSLLSRRIVYSIYYNSTSTLTL